MGTHVSISGTEAADRLEIRELLEMHNVRIDVTRRDKWPFLLRTHTWLYSWTLIRETVNGIEPKRRLGAQYSMN